MDTSGDAGRGLNVSLLFSILSDTSLTNFTGFSRVLGGEADELLVQVLRDCGMENVDGGRNLNSVLQESLEALDADVARISNVTSDVANVFWHAYKKGSGNRI